jgi:pyruvate formate lyase activating enzyme
VKRDKPFYDTSGGGVTISGGEPTMQSIFLFELLEKLKKEQIHTAIETCGFFKEELIKKLVNTVDLFLFDIKHMDPDLHKEFTNVSNDKILHNFKEILLKVGSERIIPRIPLIPGVNTAISVIKDIGDFLLNANYSGPVHLMPYNKLAKTKYEKIGKGHLYQDMGDLTEEKLQEIACVFESKSFQVVINH